MAQSSKDLDVLFFSCTFIHSFGSYNALEYFTYCLTEICSFLCLVNNCCERVCVCVCSMEWSKMQEIVFKIHNNTIRILLEMTKIDRFSSSSLSVKWRHRKLQSIKCWIPMWCDCFASIGHFSFDLLQLLIDNLDSDVINRHKTTKWALWMDVNGWRVCICVGVQFAKWFLPFQMPYRYWLLIVALLLFSSMNHKHWNYLLVQPKYRDRSNDSKWGNENGRVKTKKTIYQWY